MARMDVNTLQILLSHPLTPKGRRLIKEAINLLSAEDARSSTKLDEIDEWWKLTFADANVFGVVQKHMLLIQEFLLDALLADYLDLSYKPPQFIDDLCRLVAEEQKTAARPVVTLAFRRPVEQLDLDPFHIMKRLLRIFDGLEAGKSTFGRASPEILKDFLSGDYRLLAHLREQRAITETHFQNLRKAMENFKRGDRGEREDSWYAWIQTQGERFFSGASNDSGEAPRYTPGHLDGKSLQQDSRDTALSHDVNTTEGLPHFLGRTNGQVVYNRKQGTG